MITKKEKLLADIIIQCLEREKIFKPPFFIYGLMLQEEINLTIHLSFILHINQKETPKKISRKFWTFEKA